MTAESKSEYIMGYWVGLCDGAIVGAELGLTVGDSLGVLVGDSLGAAVGCGVGQSTEGTIRSSAEKQCVKELVDLTITTTSLYMKCVQSAHRKHNLLTRNRWNYYLHRAHKHWYHFLPKRW